MRRLSTLISALISFTAAAQETKAPPPAQSAVLVGVVAAVNDEIAAKQAEALARFVAIAVKETTLPRVFPDQEALALAVSKGEVDVALMGPLAYLRVDPRSKTQLMFRTVRQGKSTYRSVLFAPPSSKLTSLDALKKNKKPLKVAWVETSSATGYVIPKALLLQAGINPAQSFEVQDFLGSHGAVCKAVMEGKYDLGATFSDPVVNDSKVSGCVNALGNRVDTLKIVAMSSEVPNDVMVSAPKFSKGKVDAIIAAAKSASTSADGKKWLQAALLAEGVADVKDEDFAPLRKALDAFVP
ncbi:MAG: PhnD/SsuA/transferrin family substrate-binding protein [Archangium sp.]|nr:PhnD/SsuA/transferrin family substrate-binding protein [Archangium sp.]MDP3569278.1 PhnD/SsuA/transferrin family substrate-binding protein [Archangium sp.]